MNKKIVDNVIDRTTSLDLHINVINFFVIKFFKLIFKYKTIIDNEFVRDDVFKLQEDYKILYSQMMIFKNNLYNLSNKIINLK